jgi:glycosyltransferase involved in cell wall biosynthesis
MKISIAIPSLNFCGGAEAVALSLIKLLKEQGYDLMLKTVDKPNWKKIEKILGYSITVDELYKLDTDVTENLNPLNILKLVKIYKNLLEKDDSLLINMYGDLDIYLDKGDITYINGIPFSIIDDDKTPIYMKGIIRSIYRRFTRYKRSNILISNSYYTKETIKDKLSLESYVIHPPPTLRDIQITNKEDIILTITRIAEGKKLERVLQIADALKDKKFIIVGRMYDQTYYKRFLDKSREMQISNVIFLINKPRNIMLDYLAKSKVLLHTMDNETYGLSIIEGMLARCIPIVPKNGGPWIDILDRKDGIYGYSYASIDEAIQKIDIVMNNYSLADDAYERAITLSREFYEQFPKIIDSIIKL